MSGNKYLFDTNALINFFKGHPSLAAFKEHFIVISIISVLEYLSFAELSIEDKTLFNEFLKITEVVDISISQSLLLYTTTDIRKKHRLKLPDALIAATAISMKIPLVTNDHDFRRVDGLNLHLY